MLAIVTLPADGDRTVQGSPARHGLARPTVGADPPERAATGEYLLASYHVVPGCVRAASPSDGGSSGVKGSGECGRPTGGGGGRGRSFLGIRGIGPVRTHFRRTDVQESSYGGAMTSRHTMEASINSTDWGTLWMTSVTDGHAGYARLTFCSP